MGILADIDALYAGAPAKPAAPLAPAQPSAFSRGLRAGGADLAGQARALLGQGAELLGADQLAAEQRAASVAAQQEGASIMEGLPQSYHDVHGLRDAWDYATGLVGRAGPGLVPMAAGAAVGGIPGMIAATMPSTIGAQFEAQQEDPVAAAKPVGERTLTGAVAGGAEAAVMGVVPGVMGGKLFAKAATGAARVPLGQAVATNLGEAVVGNAVAGNVAARIGQGAAGALNPARDTSQDEAQQMEATVGGAVMGAPFAALGVAGSRRAPKAPKEPAPAKPGAATPDAPATFEQQLAGLSAALTPDHVTGREHADAAIDGTETPATMAGRDAAGEDQARTKAQAKVAKLLADPEAAHLHAELNQLDPVTTSGQQRIGELNVQHFTAQKRKADLAADNATLDAALRSAPEEAGEAAKDYSGAEAKVYDLMDGPEWADFSAEDKQAAVALLRKAVETGERTGEIPMLRAARTVMRGQDLADRLLRVYHVLGSSDPARREQFFAAFAKMNAHIKRDDGLRYAVKSALPQHLRGIGDDQVDAFIDGMKAVSGENLSKSMGANEMKVAKTRIDDHLFDIFGDKAEGLIGAFAKHAQDSEELVPAGLEEKAKLKSAADEHAEGDEANPAVEGSGEGAAPRREGVEADTDNGDVHIYYGRKPDAKDRSPFVLNDAAHAKLYPHDSDATRPQSKRMARAAAENPVPPDPYAEDPGAPPRNVRWMGAREFAELHGMDQEQLARHTGGKPDDYGLAVVRVPKQDEFSLSDADLDGMRFGRHTMATDPVTGKQVEKHTAPASGWLKSEKARETAFEVGEHLFDATRVASYMARSDGHGKGIAFSAADDAHGKTYRTARAFAEGIAALSIKLGRQIEVPEHVIVERAKGGRPALTWGDLQDVLKDGTASAARALAPLRNERDSLYADRAKAVGDKAQAAFADAIEDVNARIAQVRKAHGMDREAFDGSDSTTAELQAKLSDRQVELERSQEAQARLEAKASRSKQEEKNLAYHRRQVAFLQPMVASLTHTLEQRANAATFNEAKLGSEHGTGRDIGEGIDLRREQLRAAEAGAAQYQHLLEQLNAHKPGSPGEGAVWARERERVKAQIKTSFSRTPRDEVMASKPYRRMEGYLRIVEKRDRAQIEALRERALAAADASGKTFETVDGKPVVAAARRGEDAAGNQAPALDASGKPVTAEKRRETTWRKAVGGDDSGLGISEADPLGNVHHAAAEHGTEDNPDALGEVASKVRQKAGEYTEPTEPRDLAPVLPEARWAALNALPATLPKNLGAALRALIDNAGILSKAHRKEFDKLIGDDGKPRDQAALRATVKDLVGKYRTSPSWSSTGEHAFANIASEGGPVHAAILKKVAKSEDARELHTALLDLLGSKNPNEHKARVIDAMTARIGELMAEYPDTGYALQLKSAQETGGMLTPAQQAFADKVGKGGVTSRRTVDGMRTSDDVAALQRAQRALAGADPDNVHVARALGVIEDRLAALEGKTAAKPATAKPEPEGTMYSLESTRVHDELERDGFAATHDSPIRHDGTFNWRAHEGNGEGNDVYGAGTYLSTAEEVHQGYKKQFTRAIKGDGLINNPHYRGLQEQLAALRWEDKTPANERKAAALRAEMKAFEDRYKISGLNADKSPTYHVSVDVPREHLMSWDYPISRQSAYVQQALARGAKMLDDPDQYPLPKGMQLRSFDGKPGDALRNRFGAEVYRDLAMLLGSNRDASEYLQSLGIPGHEYASDGGADLDRPNFVIYDDSRIRTNYTELSRERQGTAASSAAAQQAVHDYVNRVTGGAVDVNAAAQLLYAGSYLKGGKDAAGVDYRPVINVSVHALNPLSTAYHESLHWFADHLRQHGEPAVMAALTRAADSAYVRNFLRNKFRDQPDALKQVEGASEERVAYMYQFHRNGELQLGTRAKTILDRIGELVNRVLGVWSNDARALHIMDYFGSGQYAREFGGGPVRPGAAAAAHKAMMEVGRNKTLDRLHANFKPLLDVATAAAGIGSARIRDMGIPALTKIADLVRLHDTKEGVDPGYLPAAGIARRAFGQQLVKAMGDFTAEQANAAMAAIAQDLTPVDAHQARLMSAMRRTMGDVHAYMREAGVRIGARGLNGINGSSYAPRVWDPGAIAGHQDAFRAMIQKYIDSGDFIGSADALMTRLMRDEGTEIEPGTVAGPGDQHAKTRELHFITAADAAPFVEKDALRILTSYIAQGTRRAEWSRRFEAMSAAERRHFETLTPYAQRQFELERERPLAMLKRNAVEQGATPDQIKQLDRYLEGVTGQLGRDVRPATRRLFAQVMVYQNLRLLPLGFFSTLIDPVGVKVRGGTLGDVFNNFKRGILEIPRGFQNNPKSDAGYRFAEDLGVIDSAVLQHVMGASYGLGAAGNRTRALNEAVFKWNLMDQMNTSQRVGATEAALRFLLRHRDGDASEHSLRYLGELGLKPADIKVVGSGRDARVAVRPEDFSAAGYTEAAALAAHLKMRQAVNRWVDGAILRPDQSNKAIWMNDPMYALVAHMKQFSFAFQDTILKRVLHEARHGNYQPAAALAGYIPVMLAADLARGAIQGGGSQPDWKQGWDLGDYLANAIQRAGLFGVGQFALDAVKEVRHGHTGIGALGGPTVAQLAQVVATVGGQRSLAATTIDAMPANALWSGYLPGTTRSHSLGHDGDSTEYSPTEPMQIDD
jgi:hypothetical protein